MDNKNMTSPCGLDCFNCILYLANNDAKLKSTVKDQLDNLNIKPDKIVCQGCRNEKGIKVFSSTPCTTYKCVQEKGLDFCYECSDFPCDELHPYADQAAIRPHNTKIFNLCLIKKMGLEKWCKEKAQKVKETYFNKKMNL